MISNASHLSSADGIWKRLADDPRLRTRMATIQVDYDGIVVTLRGRTSSYFQKQLLQEAVKSLGFPIHNLVEVD